MDWIAGKGKVQNFLKKFRLVIIVLLAGILLLTLPSGEEEEQTTAPVAQGFHFRTLWRKYSVKFPVQARYQFY